MKIYIKNTVCPVFLHFIRFELERLGISYSKIERKEIVVADNISENKFYELRDALQNYEIEIDVEKRSKNVLKIKHCISEYIDNQKLETLLTLPQFIVSKMHQDYDVLNNTFYHETGMSIEKFYKWKKVNLAIKLLVHYNLTINEVSYQLNYENEFALIQHFEEEIGVIPECKNQLVNSI